MGDLDLDFAFGWYGLPANFEDDGHHVVPDTGHTGCKVGFLRGRGATWLYSLLSNGDICALRSCGFPGCVPARRLRASLEDLEDFENVQCDHRLEGHSQKAAADLQQWLRLWSDAPVPLNIKQA